MVSSFGKLSAHQFKVNARLFLPHNTFVGYVVSDSGVSLLRAQSQSKATRLLHLDPSQAPAKTPFPQEEGKPLSRT
jgi:hypothetical protein